MSNIRCLNRGRIESVALIESLKGVEFRELVIFGIDKDGYLFSTAMTDKLDEVNALIDIGKAYIVGQMATVVPRKD